MKVDGVIWHFIYWFLSVICSRWTLRRHWCYCIGASVISLWHLWSRYNIIVAIDNVNLKVAVFGRQHALIQYVDIDWVMIKQWGALLFTFPVSLAASVAEPIPSESLGSDRRMTGYCSISNHPEKGATEEDMVELARELFKVVAVGLSCTLLWYGILESLSLE